MNPNFTDYEITYSGIDQFLKLNEIFKNSGLNSGDYIKYSTLENLKVRVEKENYFYFDKSFNYYRTDFYSHKDSQDLKSISYKDFIKIIKNRKIPKWKRHWKEI